jgi:serine/threonine protein kinase
MPDLLPDSSPTTGELLDGRYLLDSRIGVGGMGVVYRARDQMLGRIVAVKVFRDSSDDAARTTSETRLLASLNHSSLVTLFDAQTGSRQPNYLVMEYVDGPTLGERIAQGALSSRHVAVMAHDLAEALHVVHQAGIVHRDIKPSNVLLRHSHVPGEDYRAKLADFGIAYLVDSTRHTTPGTLIGTAAYLSPEQVRGSEPAPASDIYALGLILLESLTGERAFPQTGTHEAALARLSQDPTIPGSLGYSWKSLLSAMTARDPESRPTALEVVLAAGRIATEAPLEETEATGGLMPAPTMVLPAATGTLSITKPKAWQIIVAIAALIIVALIVGLLIWALGASRPTETTVLPALNDPLATHMQQLLDSVKP